MKNNEIAFEELRLKVLNTFDILQNKGLDHETNFKEIISIIDKLQNTQLKLIENLKSSKAEFEEVFNSTNEAILIIDSESGEIIDVNNRTLEIFGYNNKNEILRLNFINFNTKNNQNSFKDLQSHFSKATNGDVQLFDLLSYKKNGDSFWVSISLKKSKIGGKERIIAVERNINERKKTEEKLKNREQQLSTLINSMPDIICFKDGDGRWLEANNYDLNLFELENINYKGKKDSELAQYSNFYKNAFLACEDTDELAWQKGSICRNDEIIPKPDGTSLVFDIIKVPTFDKYGKRKGLIVVGRDITEKKLAEKKLIESEEKFKAAFKISPDAISISRLSDGKYIDINDGFVEISGYKRCEIIGKSAFDINIWNNVADRELLAQKLKVDGFANNFEFFFKLKNGKKILATLSARILIINEEPHLLAITKDITEQKKNHEALKLAAKQWEDTFDSTLDAICLLDCNQKILRVNKSMLNFFEITKKEVKNKHCWEIIHKTSSPIKNCVVNKAIISKKRESFELTLKNKIVVASADPIIDKNGNVLGLIHIIRDITNEKNSQKSLKESEERYRTVVSSSSEGIILQDKNGKILTWNLAAEQVFGIKEKEVLGQTSSSRNYNLYKEDGTAYLGEEHPSMLTLKTGKPCKNILMKVLNNKNELLWLKVNTNPVFVENKEKPDFVVISFSEITNLKRIEQALQEQKDIYSTIVNQANDAIGLIDPENGNFFEFNKKAHEILGYTREEFSKLCLSDIEYKHQKETVLNTLQTLATGGEKTFETQHKHKNGSILDIRVSTNSVSIKGKLYVAGIWSDITEKKKQEEELKEKNLIFQSLMDNSPIYIFFKDDNIRAMHLSKNFEQMLGMPIKDAIGKNMYELFPSELALKMMSDDKKIIEEGKLIQVDEELNGKYYTTIKFPIKRENDTSILAGFTLDITDRKKVEIALKQSEARLSSFMHYLPALIIIKDNEFRPIFANEQLKSLFPMDKWMGKKPHEIFDNETASNMIEKDQVALNHGYSSYEETWTDKFGKEHIYFTQKFRIDLPDSLPLLGAIITDITKQKATETQIKELNFSLEKRVEARTAELTEANKELESFAYTVSHDLRAPLRAIDGFTNILKEDYYKHFDEKGKKVCKTISDNALKMGHLIDDLLAFSRIGRNEMNYLTINTKQMVETIIQDNFLNGQTGKYQIIINDLPIIKGDRSMIKQVWINLISNAIKFSSKKEFPKIEIGFNENEIDFIFFISDNGSGFDTKYSDKLFGVFQRLHSATEFEGTGVGLAIVQRIINRHGGKIWADSEPDKGSVFYFTIKK